MAEIGKDIAKAKALLEQGKLVAIPTETVYGLAGNALDPSAVTKIFSTKERPYFDPLIVHVPDVDSVKKYVDQIPVKALSLMKEFWPGPITFLLNRKEIIPDLVTSGLDRVGIRCPNHDLTHELLKSLSFPLAAPSANPFGYVSPTNPEHVNEQMGDRIDYILDGGECNVGIESTCAAVPSTTRSTPSASHSSIAASERMPPPSSSGTPFATARMARTASVLPGRPSFAPSRSTTWSRRNACSVKRLATAAGSAS